jgi:hypothetical protein
MRMPHVVHLKAKGVLQVVAWLLTAEPCPIAARSVMSTTARSGASGKALAT